MKVFKVAKYTACFLLGSLLALLVTYKVAGWLSLYPNDWFLDNHAYENHSSYFLEKNPRFRFICNLEEKEIFSPYLSQFSKIIENNPNQILRKHPSRTVFLIQLGEKKYLLKRYNIKSFFNWLQKAPIRSSQAYRSWYYGHELIKLGISTPKPIALYEKKIGPFWSTTYILTEYIEGRKDLTSEYKSFSQNERLELIREIKTQVDKLTQAHLIHSDYGFRNLLVLNHKIYVIDLDDLHHYRSSNRFFKKRSRKKHQGQLERDHGLYVVDSNSEPFR